MTQPSQITHPWRATVRTTAATLVALAAVVGPHLATVDWSDTSTYGLAIAVTALVTRVLADPRTEAILTRRAPMLAADPDAHQLDPDTEGDTTP